MVVYAKVVGSVEELTLAVAEGMEKTGLDGWGTPERLLERYPVDSGFPCIVCIDLSDEQTEEDGAAVMTVKIVYLPVAIHEAVVA